MVRAAAKNFRDVLVVVDPADYPRVLAALDAPGGRRCAFRFELARKAFAHTAAYDTRDRGDAARRSTIDGDGLAARGTCRTSGRRRLALDLREDPRPALRREPAPARGVVSPTAGDGLGDATMLQGKELSYTNLLDLDSAARIALEFAEPAAVVIKHTNPCGAATGDVDRRRLRARARRRRLAAFGGIVGLNRPIDVGDGRGDRRRRSSRR